MSPFSSGVHLSNLSKNVGPPQPPATRIHLKRFNSKNFNDPVQCKRVVVSMKYSTVAVVATRIIRTVYRGTKLLALRSKSTHSSSSWSNDSLSSSSIPLERMRS